MLTTVLLTGAGLLIQALNRFASAPLGFQPDGLVTASISFLHAGDATPERRIQFYERIRTGLAAVAGIQDVAFASAGPITGGGVTDVVEVEGHPEPQFEKAFDTYQHTVSSDYFRTMKIPSLAGRFFDRGDSSRNQPVAIVNEALVRKYFRHEDPIGKYVRPFSHKGPWFRVVGVMGNEKRTTVYQEMAWADSPVIYRPLDQNPFGVSNVIVRASGNGRAIAASIQRTISAIDRDIPVEQVQTVRDLEAKHFAYPRFRATVVGAFACLALILAVIGLFSILSQLVAQRTHEIGVRMALGAQKREVLGLVIWQGVMLTGAGLVAGLTAAFELTKLLRGLLYGVRATDPWTLVDVSILLVAVALLAAYIPARRAASIDPMVALRYE
jgi:putative ABC transport system permease protein